MKKLNKKIIIPIVIITLVGLGGFYIVFKNSNNNDPATQPDAQVVTKVGPEISDDNKAPTTSATEKIPKKTSNGSGGREISTGTDTNGTAQILSKSSQWITSKSGVITVKQPVVNQKITGQIELAGTAKVKKINYRLIDDSVGVVSQGTLNVNNGKFSGVINPLSTSKNGRLDIFSTDVSFRELNEIQINLRF